MNGPNIVIGVTTFDRPRQYLSTIGHLQEAGKGHSLTVVAVQDGGKPYVKGVEDHGFTVIPVHKGNDGKRGYWMTVNACLQRAMSLRPIYYVQLPDDVEYQQGWLTKALELMRFVGNKSAINLLACHRSQTGTWGIMPRPFNAELLENGFLDGAFITHAKVMERLQWTVLQVGFDRWDHDKRLGSGVWAQVTRRLLRKGVSMYNLTDPWLTTDWSGENSKMNANRVTA